MRIVQLVPSLLARDAVGNEVIAFDSLLKNNGYSTAIFTMAIRDVDDLSNINLAFEGEMLAEDDVLLYHFAIGSPLTDYFIRQKCKKVLCYHNVTPASFFKPYDFTVAYGCGQSMQQLIALSEHTDYCIADSEYNKQELRDYGFRQPIDVVPILLDFDDYKSTYDPELLEQLQSRKGTKILFIGRVAPNKKFEDIIKAFHVYKKRYDSDAELNLVGSFNEGDLYYASLREYVDKLGVEDVVFTGSIPFSHINAYYKGSDVLLCQSEHEGFCVPIIESMIHELPIVGYDCCAVGETMGQGSLAIPTKDPEIVAGVLDRLMQSEELRAEAIAAQSKHLKWYEPSCVEQKFLNAIKKVIDAS